MASIVRAIPWYETWFPINLGTLPGWVLTFLWSFGVCWWFARPFRRPLLLHLGYFLMMLFCAAICWSFFCGFLRSRDGTWLLVTGIPTSFFQERDLYYWFLRAAAPAAGLTLLFTLIVVTSAILFLANLELSSTSYRSTSDEAQPDEPD
jgi:hypothetical protein